MFCHNQAAHDLKQITFPSGEVMTEASPSAICMVCHQGRASSDSVNAAIAGAEDDTVNIHRHDPAVPLVVETEYRQ